MAEEALPGTSRANTHSERFRDAMNQMRTRTDVTAKAIAAIGTAAVSAIGYAKLADIFPYGGPPVALVGLVVGVLAMMLAVGLLVRRFFRAGQVVITNPDWRETVDLNDLDRAEAHLLKGAYNDSARVSEAESLVELDALGRKLEEEARAEEDSAKAKALYRQAERIFAEVQAAQDRGAAFIVRRRSTHALFGLRTLLPLALFVLGWYGTALGADSLESNRKDKVDVAVACADAREKKEIVKEKLPDICGEEEAKEEEAKNRGEEGKSQQSAQSPGKIKRRAIAALAAAQAECRRARQKAGKSRRVCRSLEAALRASRGPVLQRR